MLGTGSWSLIDYGVSAELLWFTVSPPSYPPVEVYILITLGRDTYLGVHVLFAQQELVEIGFHFGILALGQLAVAMTGNNGIAHTVFDAKLFPYFHGTVHRNIA